MARSRARSWQSSRWKARLSHRFVGVWWIGGGLCLERLVSLVFGVFGTSHWHIKEKTGSLRHVDANTT
jgi:hypothetical protein